MITPICPTRGTKANILALTTAHAWQLFYAIDTKEFYIWNGTAMVLAGSSGSSGSMPSGAPNQVLATDPSGSATDVAALRALVAADIPSLPESQITNLVSDLASKQAALGFTPENSANKGTAAGYCELDSASLVPATRIKHLAGSIAAFSPHADGVTDDSGAFTTAQGTYNEIWLEPNKTYAIGSNLTLTASIRFAAGSRFVVLNGFTLTLNGQVHAAVGQQIFVVGTSVGFNQSAYDTFVRGNESPISDGGKWTVPSNFGGTTTLDGGSLVSNKWQPITNDKWSVAYWNTQGAIGDQWASITIATPPPSQSNIAVMVRGSLTASTYYYFLVNGSSWQIGKAINGSGTTFTTGSSAGLSAGDVMTLSIVGTTLTAYKNGIQVLTATDASIATGYPGMSVFGHTTATNAQLMGFNTGTPVAAITGGSVVIGPNTPEVHPSWFGAKGDYNMVTGAGTDDTSALQAAITAVSSKGLGVGIVTTSSPALATPPYNGAVRLAAKTYLTTSGLKLQASNVAICGANTFSSVILCNSPTADILLVSGTSSSSANLVTGVLLREFSLMRSVQYPSTVTNASLHCKWAIATYFDHMFAYDSLYGFYVDNVSGHVDMYRCEAVYSGISPTGSCHGFHVNSSLTSSRWIDCIADGSRYGLFTVSGGADFFCEGFETAGCNTSMFFAGGWSDTIIIRPICESAPGGITVDVNTTNIIQIFGGYFNSSPLVISSGATGVLMYGGQFTGNNASGQIQVAGKNCVISGCYVIKNTSATPTPGIVLSGASGCTVVGNNVVGAAGTPLSTGISLASSSKNSIVGNNVSGSGTTGLAYDASSSNNASTGNVVDTTSITTAKSDLGTGNTAGL